MDISSQQNGDMAMDENQILALLKQIRPLAPDQWEAREVEAKSTIKTKIGKKPIQKDFAMEGKKKMGLIQWLMLALLLLLLLFSILHVFTWTRTQAMNSYDTLHPETLEGEAADTNAEVGINIGQNLYVILHQLSVMGVTELGMIALSVWHIYRAKYSGLPDRPEGKFETVIWLIRRYFYLVLAAVCGLVILGANLSSGFNALVSFIVPILTISLSEIFAQIAGESYTENLDTEVRYRAAAQRWQEWSLTPETHPEYQSVLTGTIQAWYRKNNAYKDIPWTAALLRYVSAREKATHAHASDDQALVERFAALADAPLSGTAQSNGSSPTQPQPSSLEPSNLFSPPLGLSAVNGITPSSSNGNHHQP